MDHDGGNHEPNRKGRRREAGSEGSGTQTPGPRYTKRIKGIHPWARRPEDPKPNSHPEGVGVYATGIWEESRSFPYERSSTGKVVCTAGTRQLSCEVSEF